MLLKKTRIKKTAHLDNEDEKNMYYKKHCI